MALDDKLMNIAEKTAVFVGFSACAEAIQYGTTYLMNNEISSNPLFSALAGAGLAVTYYFNKDSDYQSPLKKFEESNYQWIKKRYDDNQKE